MFSSTDSISVLLRGHETLVDCFCRGSDQNLQVFLRRFRTRNRYLSCFFLQFPFPLSYKFPGPHVVSYKVQSPLFRSSYFFCYRLVSRTSVLRDTEKFLKCVLGHPLLLLGFIKFTSYLKFPKHTHTRVCTSVRTQTSPHTSTFGLPYCSALTSTDSSGSHDSIKSDLSPP